MAGNKHINTSPLRAIYKMVLVDDEGNVIPEAGQELNDKRRILRRRNILKARYQKRWNYKPTKE